MTRKRSRTGAERFAALTAAIERPDVSWSDLMTLLARWPPDQDPEQALAMVEAVADRFPPADRGISRLVRQQLLALDVRPYLRLLRVVNLRSLWPVSDRARLFGRMIHEGGIRELCSFVTRYDRGEALALLIARHITGLRYLYLGGSSIGATGARTLAETPALAGLRALSLHNNHIDDAGAQALVDSPYLRELSFLNLYNNELSPRMVKRILAAPAWQSTTILVNDQRPQG